MDPTSKALTAASLIVKAAADNPDFKEAGKNLGRAASTLTKLVENCLLPIAAVNFGFDKAKRYFQEKFPGDMAEKVSAIPAEEVIEPKPSVAGPALQGLAFAHEEPNLKEMFLNLLATAMDRRVAGTAHPAFVEVIRQMTAEEAHTIQVLLKEAIALSIVEVRKYSPDRQGSTLLIRHLMDIIDENGGKAEIPRFDVMVDNWLRLGLAEVDYEHALQDMTKYDWILQRPEIQRLSVSERVNPRELHYRKGIIQRTGFGLQFAKAVGLLEN